MTINGYIVTDAAGSVILGWGVTPEAADADASEMDYSEADSFAELPHYQASHKLAMAYNFGAAGGHELFVIRDGIAMRPSEAAPELG